MQGKGKAFYGEILTKKNVQGIVVDNILDIMPILHDVEVDLMLEDLEIQDELSILLSIDMLITDYDALNNDTACKKGIMN